MRQIAGVVHSILFLARVSTDALVPWLGCLSASALNRTNRISIFSQICSLSPILLEMLPFLSKTYKTRKIQKESKIAQISKTKRLTNIN
jgi:hypothetical protein